MIGNPLAFETEIVKEETIISRSYINFLTLNCALGSYFFGYSLSVLNTASDKMQTYYQWTS